MSDKKKKANFSYVEATECSYRDTVDKDVDKDEKDRKPR